MSRYKSGQIPQDVSQSLADFLRRELARIQDNLTDLNDGLLEAAREFPPRNDTVLLYGDSSFDLGDGVGLYLRVGTQWYKLDMTPVSGGFPATGTVNVVGNTPTVS